MITRNIPIHIFLVSEIYLLKSQNFFIFQITSKVFMVDHSIIVVVWLYIILVVYSATGKF